MPQHPISLNLARIIYRVMLDPRGWRVDRLKDELEIADRTYRKYRTLLTAPGGPFLTSSGVSMVEEVEDGPFRYLRLRRDDQVPLDDSLTTRLAALHLAHQALGFLAETEVAEAVDGVLEGFEAALRQRPATRNLLRNVDRLLYHVPDAPKDYWGKRGVLRQLLGALFTHQQLVVVYEASNATTRTRTLEPLSLLSWRSALYLLARDAGSDEVKTFAVDRLLEAERSPVRFDYPPPAHFHPERFTEGCFGIFQEHDAEPVEVELLFTDLRWLKVYLRERRWHPTQRFEDLEDGRLRMTFTVSTMVEVWPWIRRFGEDVEVVRPAGGVPRSFSGG